MSTPTPAPRAKQAGTVKMECDLRFALDFVQRYLEERQEPAFADLVRQAIDRLNDYSDTHDALHSLLGALEELGWDRMPGSMCEHLTEQCGNARALLSREVPS